MATYRDVATDADMVKIANAIRIVTETTKGMTIPEMPELLLSSLSFVKIAFETHEIAISGDGVGKRYSLGVYDKKPNQLFLVFPATSSDVSDLAFYKARDILEWVEEKKELFINFNKPLDKDIHLVVSRAINNEGSVTKGILIANKGEMEENLYNICTLSGGRPLKEREDLDKLADVRENNLYAPSVEIASTILGTPAEKLAAKELFVLKNLSFNNLVDKVQLLIYESGEIFIRNIANRVWKKLILNDTLNTELAKKVDKTTTINGHSLDNNIDLTKEDVGLGNVDNTSDELKPLSKASREALDKKVDIIRETEKAYVTDKFGNTTSKQYNVEPYGGGLVERTSDGRVKGEDATEPNDLVNKKLLEDAIGTLDTSKLTVTRYIVANGIITQQDAAALIGRYAELEGTLIEFLSNTQAPNKVIAYGILTMNPSGDKFLTELNYDGIFTQWNAYTHKQLFATKEDIVGLVSYREGR